MSTPSRPMLLLARSMAASLVVAGVVVAWPTGPASAESPDAVGWWNKTKQEFPSELGGDPTPPPPDVPNNGFLVSNDPSEGASGETNEALVPEEAGASSDDVAGPTSVAALRFEATRARKAVLTLEAGQANPVTGEEVEDATFPPNASIVACPVVGQWEQVSDGAWNRRPELDCLTVASPGELSDDLTTVTFQINEEFFRLGVLVSTIEIGLRPEPGYAQPFRATFAKPGFDALVADGPLIEPAGAAEGGAVVAPPPPLPASAPLTPAPISGGTFDDPVAAPNASAGQRSIEVPESSTPVGQETASPISAPDSTSDRVLAGVLLVLMGMGLFLATTRQPHEPRLIGGLAHRGLDEDAGAEAAPAEAEARGLGRFRRARDKAPVG